MNKAIITAIDFEISRLQQARRLLSGGNKTGYGSPKKAPAKRVLSPEARAKIVAAQKKRWAKAKAAKKAA